MDDLVIYLQTEFSTRSRATECRFMLPLGFWFLFLEMLPRETELDSVKFFILAVAHIVTTADFSDYRQIKSQGTTMDDLDFYFADRIAAKVQGD